MQVYIVALNPKPLSPDMYAPQKDPNAVGSSVEGGREEVCQRPATNRVTETAGPSLSNVSGACLGYCHPQYQSILGVLLRGINHHIILIIQLLLSGGSTQSMSNFMIDFAVCDGSTTMS